MLSTKYRGYTITRLSWGWWRASRNTGLIRNFIAPDLAEIIDLADKSFEPDAYRKYRGILFR